MGRRTAISEKLFIKMFLREGRLRRPVVHLVDQYEVFTSLFNIVVVMECHLDDYGVVKIFLCPKNV